MKAKSISTICINLLTTSFLKIGGIIGKTLPNYLVTNQINNVEKLCVHSMYESVYNTGDEFPSNPLSTALLALHPVFVGKTPIY